MSGQATTLRSDGRGPAPQPSRPDALAPGTEVGRYVILSVAGSGAFGIVYRAYDPELDRSVALKHFNAPSRSDEHGTQEEAGRVMQEARALAKFRHPNIVAVYDAGEHDERAFVAMEYVPGSDLELWLLETPRPWDEAARVLANAAAGLHAAHTAGILHRDFKPQNVLVSPSGVGYVADFGLAIGTDAKGPEAEGSPRPPGTPAYLAPELYAGEPATVRSDVYSFCVTLWEAAYGERPWGATSETTLIEEKLHGPPAFPKPGVLPRRVASLVVRGLAADPAARPETLAEIVEALAGREGGARRWMVAGGAVAAAAGLAAFVSARDEAPCAKAAVAIDAVWNEESRAKLQQRITETQGANADETWTRIQLGIDRWETRWRAQRIDACEATHVRHEQSEALLDRRGRCFDRELQTLSMLLAVLRTGENSVLVRAPRAADRLSRELDCSLAAVETDKTEVSAELEPMLADLDRAQVLETVAMYEDGLKLATDLEARAQAAGATEITLRARHRRGRLLHATGARNEAVELYTAVHWEAEALGIDDLSATAGMDAMFEYAAPLGKPEVALQWEPHVSAAVRRAGGEPKSRATLWDNRGIALLYSGDLRGALQAHREALALRESYDQEGFDTVATLQNLGIVYEEQSQYERAIEAQQRALAILRRLLGDHHPDTARVRDNLGTAQLRSGDVAIATENFQGALETRRSALGPKHPSVALSHMHLALAALEEDAPTRAIAHYQTALDVLDDAQSDPRNVALCHEGLAHAQFAAGRPDKAKAHARIALDVIEPLLPEDHPEVLGLRAILAGETP